MVGRKAKGTDHQLQWTTHPYASASHSSHHSTPMDALMDFEDPTQRTAQHDHIISEAHLLDCLHGSPPDVSVPPTPVMQVARTENFLQMNEANWDQNNDHEFQVIPDMQPTLAFDMPNSTDFMFPVSSKYNPSGTLDIDVASGLSQNLSAAWNPSPKSFVYPYNNQLPADVFGSGYCQTSYHSQPASSQRNIQEHQSLIAAQAHWNSFRFTPVMNPNVCPKTASEHLEELEQTLINQDA